MTLRDESAMPSTMPSSRDVAPSADTARPSRVLRQSGYGVAAGANAALLFLVNVAPGWQWVPFLTDDFAGVVGLLNASLACAIAVNLLWVLTDPPWLRALGQIVQSGIGLAVVLELLDVFPFDFTDMAFNGSWLARFVLVVAAIGTAIGLLVQVATLVRIVVATDLRPADGR